MEFDLIELLKRRFPDYIGDDCAVVPPREGRLLVTVDELCEGIHFSLEYFSLSDVGYKSVSAACSDIAAMGGTPAGVVLALGLPEGFSEAELAELYDGVSDFCGRWGISVYGGNISGSRCGVRVVTAVLGFAEAPVMRSGARPGDLIAVTGELGASSAGMLLLSRAVEARLDDKLFSALARRHRRPDARIDAGKIIASLGATAMIDVSDGFWSDLVHLARASGVGVSVDLGRLPLACGVSTVAEALGVLPQVFAARSGEEFELVFTAPEDAMRRIRSELAERLGLAATVVGEVTSSPKLCARLEGKSVPPEEMQGWQHLSKG